MLWNLRRMLACLICVAGFKLGRPRLCPLPTPSADYKAHAPCGRPSQPPDAAPAPLQTFSRILLHDTHTQAPQRSPHRDAPYTYSR